MSAMGKIFIHGQVRMQRRDLGKESDELFRLFRFFPKVDPIDQDLPFCLIEHTAEDIHGRRLSCSIGTQQAQDAILGDLKIDIPDSPGLTVPMREMLYFYNCRAHK
jgi:hypothetical protein